MTEPENATSYRGFRSWRRCAAALAMVFALAVSAGAAETAEPADVLDLPLERLLDVSVITASRKTQSLSDVASAVFVITEEDIRHSGATTIPDLLRMVPGVQVGTTDGNTWAVSVRGFNGIFANKLLVMIDGRTVYTPLYGGVFWDVQDTLLENIESIEVIRGSGSTMWGANAVNGVINIITKNAEYTKGGLLTGLTGSRERGTVGARYGGELGQNGGYRLYLKHTERGGTPGSSVPSNDTLSVTRGGFRTDSTLGEGVNLTVQGDLYGGTADHSYTVPSFTPPFTQTPRYGAELFGANLISRVDWLQSQNSKFSFQLYYDHTDRDIPLVRETRDTFDLDLQHNTRLGERNEVTWGVGYRLLHDLTKGSPFFYLVPESRTLTLVNLFLQDEITLVPDRLRLILGSKFERNEYTGWEIQPAAKLSWTPSKAYSLWASITRSVRTPTRGENDVRIGVAVLPPVPPANQPALLAVTGNPGLSSESLLAYEAGFRADLSHAVSLDLSAFYNRYQHIIGYRIGAPFVERGQTVVPNYFTNASGVDSTGAELSLQWQPLEWWKLKGGYAYLTFFGDAADGELGSRATPVHQGTLRSLMNLGRSVDVDLWGRYVGHNFNQLQTGRVEIPAYLTLDARVAWRALPGVELSVVGQNLLQGRHLEAVTEQTLARHEVERTVYGKVAWDF